LIFEFNFNLIFSETLSTNVYRPPQRRLHLRRNESWQKLLKLSTSKVKAQPQKLLKLSISKVKTLNLES